MFSPPRLWVQSAVRELRSRKPPPPSPPTTLTAAQYVDRVLRGQRAHIRGRSWCRDPRRVSIDSAQGANSGSMNGGVCVNNTGLGRVDRVVDRTVKEQCQLGSMGARRDCWVHLYAGKKKKKNRDSPSLRCLSILLV